MAYIRSKKIKGGTYYYLVKSVRQHGKVRQITLAYLGGEKVSPARAKEIEEEYEKTKKVSE